MGFVDKEALEDKEEFLKLADGTEIRLDKILSVNNTQFYGHCAN